MLHIELMDDDIGRDESLGWVEVDVGSVVEGRELLNNWSTLEGAKHGKILFSIKFTQVTYRRFN